MSTSKRAAIFAAALFAMTAVGVYQAIEVVKAGAECYLFGYSLVLMDTTRQSMTGSNQGDVQVNHFSHVQYFPDHQFRQVVRPNNDTLYSTAWIDLAEDPLVLSVPEVKDRYYVMPLMDAWTNVFASVGTRETGTEAGDYLIAGPDWHGEVPNGLRLIRSPTNMAWMIGRIQTNTAADFDDVAKIQQQFTLTPLNTWGTGKPHSTRVVNHNHSQTAKDNPSARVAAMPASDFFSELSRLMGEQPPAETDRPILATLATFGVEPGEPFEFAKLGFVRRKLLEKSVDLARSRLLQATRKNRATENGWAVVRDGIGVYGDQYQVRSFVSMIGLGALEPVEAAYPNASLDHEGLPLRGDRRYRVHFDSGKTPPADAFWSLTVYDENGFLTDNEIKRYAIGDRDSLQRNQDGSIDILIQNDRPKGDISNWLPCPPDDFAVTMRLYLPKSEFLNGHWKLPPIVRLE